MERHPSTIGRELNRNGGGRGYRPKQAQRMADRRRLSSRRPAKLEDGPTRESVVSRLRRRWSPDQIAGRMRHDFPRQPRRWLSPQTIYNWIHSEGPIPKKW
jgi:IS30 family transposase